MKERPIYVTGHQNPDTDSIASSIAYANLKNKLGYNCLAARIGQVSLEAEYLLERYGFEEPLRIYSARCSINDIEIDDAHLVSKNLTMKEALDLILQRKNKGVFVVDENYHLEGIVSVTDVSGFLGIDTTTDKMVEIMKNVSLENVAKTLNATIIHSVDNFYASGEIAFFPSVDSNVKSGSIVVISNNPNKQRKCINDNVALLVIVGENWIDDVTLKSAKEKNVAVIYTPYDSLMVSRLIFQSPSVEKIMTKNAITVNLSETIEEATEKISNSRYRSYPVVDEYNSVVGSISRYHLFNYKKKKFILMDHNELKQSVPDIEHGTIVEVVDHHRLGGLKTDNPIDYTCMVVGSTCTIVALKYLENKVEITPDIAGILLGGIIADTLNLKSPTTSDVDIEMVKILSEISKTNPDELSQALIDSSESLLSKKFVEIVYQDFKEFKISESRVGIGQTQCKSKEEFDKVKDTLQDYLNELCVMNNYDILLVLFTHPSGSGSYYLVSGKKSSSLNIALTNVANDDGFVKGVISRKKQIVPMISELFKVR